MHSGQSCRIPHLQPKKVFITFQNFPHKSCTAHSSTESWDAPSGTARAVSNGTEQTEPSQLSELHTSGADKAQLLVKQAQGAPKPALFFCVLEQRHIKLKRYGCSKPTTEERPKGANSASLFRSSFFKMTPLSAFPLRGACNSSVLYQPRAGMNQKSALLLGSNSFLCCHCAGGKGNRTGALQCEGSAGRGSATSQGSRWR